MNVGSPVGSWIQDEKYIKKREMCLMGNSCGQFNEVTTIKNRMIVNSDRLVSGAYLQNFFESLKN